MGGRQPPRRQQLLRPQVRMGKKRQSGTQKKLDASRTALGVLKGEKAGVSPIRRQWTRSSKKLFNHLPGALYSPPALYGAERNKNTLQTGHAFQSVFGHSHEKVSYSASSKMVRRATRP